MFANIHRPFSEASPNRRQIAHEYLYSDVFLCDPYIYCHGIISLITDCLVRVSVQVIQSYQQKLYNEHFIEQKESQIALLEEQLLRAKGDEAQKFAKAVRCEMQSPQMLLKQKLEV